MIPKASFKLMFFDRKPVIDAMDRKSHTVFNRFGAETRKTAKRSLKKVRATAWPNYHLQMEKDPQKYKSNTARARLQQKVGIVSRPGEPPKRHEQGLYRLTFYAWDKTARSVVIGPLRFADSGAPALEYGGRHRGKTYKARPWMVPAFEKTLPKLPRMWRDAVQTL